MSYETYRLIFIIGAAAAGLMLITAVVLFFVLKIPRVIGDLSGSTARKAIEGIRSQTEQGGEKNQGRRQTPSGRLQGKLTKKLEGGNSQKLRTEKISTQKLAEEARRNQSAAPAEETTLLAPETTLLAPEANQTTVLAGYPETLAPETTILAPSAGETAQLRPASPAPAAPVYPQPAPQPDASAFVIEYEITYIHTNEYIA